MTINKIKDIVMKIAFNIESKYRTDFINERIIYTNNYYLDEEGMQKVDFTNIWYTTSGKTETLYAMKEEGIYSGIITNSNNSFDCSALSFCKIETADDYDLQIITKNNEKLSLEAFDIIQKYGLQVGR